MSDVTIRHFDLSDQSVVDQKFVDLGDGSYGAAISIKDRPASYPVTLTASGSVKGTPGRLYRVIVDAVGSSPTLKLHNGSSASDAALLASAARVVTATGLLYDFGPDGISFDALYAVIAVSTLTVIFVVSDL